MQRSTTLLSTLGGVITTGFFALFSGLAQAAIVTTGEVTPANPSTWASNTTITIGSSTTGTVAVNGGSGVTTGTVNMATSFGTTGTITVDGAGSSWTVPGTNSILAGTSSNQQVFAGGTGNVNITNGGVINSNLGLANAFNSNATLTIATGGKLMKSLTVAGGLGSTAVATVDGAGSTVTGDAFVGEGGTALLKITNGATVSGSQGSVARFEHSTGRVIIDGPGSAWTMGISGLKIGVGMPRMSGVGTGVVTVTNGGSMSTQGEADLGLLTRGVGTVMVSGSNSTFTSPLGINVGKDGIGRLSVTDGSMVSGKPITVNSQSLLTVDVASSVVSSAPPILPQLINNGTIRPVAKATAANGTYTPITAPGAWLGTGQVQALGGLWNNATHTLAVSNAATAQAGIATTIDRSVMQRILITDGPTGKQVGASFQAATTPANLSLTASLMNNSQLSLLQGLIDPGKAILSGWSFSATGYTAGDPMYLSLQVGGGQTFLDLDVWRFDGTGWAKYLNTDLAYDNQFASFVATGFSGYAISGLAAVPIPAAAWLFGSGLVALSGLARRGQISVSRSKQPPTTSPI